MGSIDTAILNALQVNMGYKRGERVAIVQQVWTPALGEGQKPKFDASAAVCERMQYVFSREGIDSRIISYAPTEARPGADATPTLYDAFGNDAAGGAQYPVIFMPVPFSLTHTPFRKEQTGRGSRVASMPTFTLAMFKPGGPMDADYAQLARSTREIADKLRESEYVRVTAPGTDMVVQVDRNIVHESTAMLTQPGQSGNLPGSEAYCCPVHGGNSYGHLTVPQGWGGEFPLEHAARFEVRDGRFTGVYAADSSPKAQQYLDEKVMPTLFGGEGYSVLAELGIGTNTSITPATVARDGWINLTAEKIGGSAHFANGNSAGMGGSNDVRVHVDWVVPGAHIEFGYLP